MLLLTKKNEIENKKNTHPPTFVHKVAWEPINQLCMAQVQELEIISNQLCADTPHMNNRVQGTKDKKNIF